MFYIGQKIVCVNNRESNLQEGKIYTCECINPTYRNAIYLVEIKSCDPYDGSYWMTRFKPLQEEKGTSLIEDFIEVPIQALLPK